ncbi:MAG: prepilin-type N-terminal cleavage/methylation domain-containing protein [bacterium]
MRKKRHAKGVTLIEIIVVAAIIGIAFYGIIRLLKYSYDAWFLGSSRLTLQQEARQAMSIIGQDLKNSKRSSIGNLTFNVGFENPPGNAGELDSWNSTEFTGGKVFRVFGSTETRSGFGALKLVDDTSIANGYRSYKPMADGGMYSTFTYTQDYVLSGWIMNSVVSISSSTAEVRVVTPGNADLGAPSGPVFISTPTYQNANPYWVFISTTFPQTQNINFALRFTNFSEGTEVFFDDICVAPSSFGYVGGAVNYQRPPNTPMAMGYDSYRILLNPAGGGVDSTHILRQKEDSPGVFNSFGLNPLTADVESFMIINNNQTSFDILLNLVDPDAGGVAGTQRYDMRTTVFPNVP